MKWFDVDKAIEASLFVLNKVPSCDFHKLFKILYFAESKHLAAYGRPITGDQYIAMANGPVPSSIYDILKIARGNHTFSIDRDVAESFEIINGFYVSAKRQANLDFLSKTDVNYLMASINENALLTFPQLTEKSHDNAWSKANGNSEINIIDIAATAGANSEMLKYIQSNISNYHIMNNGH
jgi:uncharacterized phage-associated protein